MIIPAPGVAALVQQRTVKEVKTEMVLSEALVPNHCGGSGALMDKRL